MMDKLLQAEDFQVMLNKLKELYKKRKQIRLMMEQCNEEVEFLETMIMFKYNSEKRKDDIGWIERLKK